VKGRLRRARVPVRRRSDKAAKSGRASSWNERIQHRRTSRRWTPRGLSARFRPRASGARVRTRAREGASSCLRALRRARAATNTSRVSFKLLLQSSPVVLRAPRMLPADLAPSIRPPLTRLSQARTTPSLPAVQTSPAEPAPALTTTDETSASFSTHDQLSTTEHEPALVKRGDGEDVGLELGSRYGRQADRRRREDGRDG
jgi:hypothetical protein